MCIRDRRWLEPQPPSKSAEQKAAAAAARALGADPSERVVDDPAAQATGLRNLGATCYMNSLLQCLFMNRSFRRGIYEWRPDPTQGCDTQQEVLKQLQRLFAYLQLSDEGCYDPSRFSEALQLNTAVQQDVQEFNKLLLSFIEEQLRLSEKRVPPSVTDLVRDQFCGKFCYEVRLPTTDSLPSVWHHFSLTILPACRLAPLAYSLPLLSLWPAALKLHC